MKEPVVRKRTMYGGIGGGNSTEPKVVSKEPEARKPLSKPRKNGDQIRKPSKDSTDIMEKPEWPARVKALGLSLKKFAKLASTPYRTVQDQAYGRVRTMGMLLMILMLMEEDEVNIRRLREYADKDSA